MRGRIAGTHACARLAAGEVRCWEGAAPDRAEAIPAASGAIQVRDILPITATIDHRYADGWQVSQAMKAFRAYLAAPDQFEPALPACDLPSVITPAR